MFKSGDKVVYIEDGKSKYSFGTGPGGGNLTNGKIYNVEFVKITGYISIIDDNGEQNVYNYIPFISLNEYREQIIEKIFKKV